MPTNYEAAKLRLYNSQKCDKLCSKPQCFEDFKKEKCNGHIKEEELVINECSKELYNNENDCKFNILFQNIICNICNGCEKKLLSKIFEILDELINKHPIKYFKIVRILKKYNDIYNIEIYDNIIKEVTINDTSDNLIKDFINRCIQINNQGDIELTKKISFTKHHKDEDITIIVLLLKLIKCFN